MAARNTIQRSLVFEAVNALRSHATAEEIFAYVSEVHRSISRATVYRNLHVLAEEGKIRRLPVPEGPDHFDHELHPHHHVRCESCGGVFDVDMEPVPDLCACIRHTHGFRFTGADLIFRGICPQCLSGEQAAQD